MLAEAVGVLEVTGSNPVGPSIKLNGPSSTVVRGRFAFQGHDLRRRSMNAVISNKTRHDQRDLWNRSCGGI
jgi:hypothetical protein